MIVGDLPYSLLRLDRPSRAGGILVAYLHDVHLALVSTGTDIEAFCAFLPLYNINFILGYLPNSYSTSDVVKLGSYINSAFKHESSNIILGDFNLSSVDWHTGIARDKSHRDFLNIIAPLGLNQLVDFPTRSLRTLDLIFTHEDRLIHDIRPCPNLGTSDHCQIEFRVNCDHTSTNPSKQPRGKIDFNRLRLLLGNIRWVNVLSSLGDDINNVWNGFMDLIIVSADQCRSQTKHRRKLKSNPLPSSILNLGRKKLTLWRRFKNDPTDTNKRSYEACRALYADKVDNWLTSCEQAVIREGNLSALFRCYREKTKMIRSLPPFLVQGNYIVTNNAKANLLNDIFVSNGVVDNNLFPSSTLSPSSTGTIRKPLQHVTFDRCRVLQTLIGLKPSHAVGPDGFSAFFYKEIACEISSALVFIFELSFNQGAIPNCWSKANVIPIFKKGNPSDPNNYRPISLTSVPCKVMEAIVRTTMLDFLHHHELILNDQFGFMPGRSSTMQLLLALDLWTESLDLGIPFDTVYFDFRKAFESVVLTKLLYKLQALSISGTLLNWIRAFISNRSQRVIIGTDSSIERNIISGVPQGSVLGPLLFVIFLNDLCTLNPSKNLLHYKFADDLKSGRHITSFSDGFDLSSQIVAIHDWSLAWQLPLSQNKCSVFHIGSMNPHLCYQLAGKPLASTEVCCDLGIWFTSDLKSSVHCQKISKLGFRRLALVKKCFVSSSLKTRVWAFRVFVRPLLEYASPVWSPYLLQDIDLLESVQRSFTRGLPGLRHLSAGDRLRAVGLEPLELRRLRADLILTYKILHGLLAIDLPFFEQPYLTSTRGHSLKLRVLKSNRECRRHFFALRVVNIWNSLTNEIVTAPTLSIFKKRLYSFSLDDRLLRTY